MVEGSGFRQKAVCAEDRRFSVQLLRFGNGAFVSVAEGDGGLGAVTVSLGAGPAPVTTAVIPARTDSLLTRLIAEKISSHTGGIAIVSYGVQGQVENATAKALIDAVWEMVQDA